MPRWRIEAIDEILMIEPPPCRAISGMTCFMARYALLRLTANTRSQSASDTSTTFPHLGDPDIVVEHIDAAMRFEACRDHGFDIGGAGHIGRERGRLAA